MKLIWSLRDRAVAALPEGTVRRRVAGGALWTLSGVLLGQLVVAVGSIAIARILGKAGFGQYAMLQSTINMFALFAGVSMSYVASKHVAEAVVGDKEKIGRIIGLSLIVAALAGLTVTLAIAVAAGPFSRRLLGGEELADALRIASPMLFFGAINGVQTGVLAGLEQFRMQNLLTTLMAIVTVALTTSGAWLLRLEGAMLGGVIAAAVSLLVFHYISHRRLSHAGIHLRFRCAWSERRVLWTLALPALLTGMMVGPIIWISNAILVNSPAGYEGMGVFNAANQWRNMLMLVPSILLTPLLPIMVQLHATRQHQRLNRVLVKTLGLSVGAVGSMALVLSLLARPILRLYGPGFETGTSIFYLIMLVAVLLSAGVVVGGLLTSIGAMWTAFFINGVWAIIMLTMAALAIPRYGAVGLAIAYLTAYLVHTCVQFIYFWTYVRGEVPGGQSRPTT